MGKKLERLYTPVVKIWSGATPFPTIAGSFLSTFQETTLLEGHSYRFFFLLNYTLPLYMTDISVRRTRDTDTFEVPCVVKKTSKWE